ncbi:MAG: DUF6062 family protein [Lachnospira sp.]
MNEKIYTIPVNDAFASDCECPVCAMYKKLEDDAVEYTMGSSYMEGDIREQTDRMGFCQKHLQKIYDVNNRLGFALVMKTHLDRVISDVEKLTDEKVASKSLFKKAERSSVCGYIDELNKKCFVCDRIDNTFNRYIDTIFYMYKHDSAFKETYSGCKGFCTTHYGVLIDKAQEKLKGGELESFVNLTNRLYLDNIKRVRDDVEWFINKFDHKYVNEPWKNAKDSLPRAMIKDGSIIDK